MKKYEIIEIDNKEVCADISLLIKSDILYFNATNIAKQFGKDMYEYLRGKSTKKYIEIVEQDINSKVGNKSPLDLVKIKKGKYGGTWLHNKLAIDFARWCSPKFAYELDKWIFDKFEEEKINKDKRLESKTGYLPLTNAIQIAYEDRSEMAKKFSYSNEADLLNILVVGMKAKKYKEIYEVEKPRDNFTVAELDLMDRLQKASTTFLDLGLSFEEKKEKLIILAHKYKNELI